MLITLDLSRSLVRWQWPLTQRQLLRRGFRTQTLLRNCSHDEVTDLVTGGYLSIGSSQRNASAGLSAATVNTTVAAS